MSGPATAVPLLERDAEMTALHTAVLAARAGKGSVVLVTGEAGLGKSSLVRSGQTRALASGARVLEAACDDLVASRVLGAVRDLGQTSAGPLRAALTNNADREHLLEALRQELEVPPLPSVVVIEDVHWADDATIDVLTWLTRRIHWLPTCLVLTYRPQEIHPAHPLRRLLGRLSDVPVVRLPLQPLSAGAVRNLAAQSSGVDAAELIQRTGGNPFFVTEVLANPAAAVPATVAEAVLGRMGLLSAGAREVLHQVAVLPGGMPHSLAEGIFADVPAAVAEAEARGMLTVTTSGITFRHELARRAVEESLPTALVRQLHQRVLTLLLAVEHPDPVLILHHGNAIGDDSLLIRYGPVAAAEAAQAGAHREAFEHYRRLMRVLNSYPESQRIELLEAFSVECYIRGHAVEAVDAQSRAIEMRLGKGEEDVGLGSALRWLARLKWFAGQEDDAQRVAQQALDVLERVGDPVALAWGRSTAAQVAMISSRYQEASRFAQLAVSVARDHGDAALLVHALNNDGVAQWLVHGRERGAPLLAESLKGALEHGLEDDACRAYVNWVGCLLEDFSYAEADQLAVEGIAYADRSEQLSSMRFLQSERASGLLCTGRWTEAVTQAQLALAGPPDASTVAALAVIGSVRVRSGDESAQEVLDAAAGAARSASAPQRLIPVAAVRAEHAWLAGRPQDIPAAIKLAMASAVATDHEWSIAEMAYWNWRAGAAGPALTGNNPFVLEMTGRPGAAALAWEALGRPYEQARALLEAGGADDLRVAATLAGRLGAEPLAQRIRTAMRAAGMPGVRAVLKHRNPCGLTDRQWEIATLLTAGMTNAEMAAQLVISVRTVDHHVADVLMKMGVSTRRAAARRAAELLAESSA